MPGDYKGSPLSYQVGTKTGFGWYNKYTQSVRVPQGLFIKLYKNNDVTGVSITLTDDTPCIKGTPVENNVQSIEVGKLTQ
jgi:hypothetical protein